MRLLITLSVVACVVLAANFATAANPGQVSHNTLSKMGVSGLQPMSDVQGTAIRGKSVNISGFSFATVLLSFATHSYGTPTPFPNQASGSTLSNASITILGNPVFGAVGGGNSQASGR
jgi:hypothetical protein